ncbi:hypothetical protein FUAX_15920 [Fulvitalea axinellae]|uniref:DUF218 domain-containing protein n=1 Tax=Fulvitalea axinellae TaxID=1182444 RepID=A0AAU9DE26_9BACT|nr:hypothetical protein FUAX_15920 [Fulvitalea axinellae]
MIFLLLALILRKRAKTRNICLGLAVVWLFVFGNTPIYEAAQKWWQVPQTEFSKLEPHQVAVVLGGGGLAPNQSLESVVQKECARSRFVVPLLLHSQGKAENLLITAGSFKKSKGQEARDLKKFYETAGIAPSRIFLDEQAVNTHQNALYSKEILDKKFPQERPLLVTNAFHMRRALATFKKAGIDCDPYASDYLHGNNEHRDFMDSIMPSPKVLDEWNRLFKEMIGYIAYKVTGKL